MRTFTRRGILRAGAGGAAALVLTPGRSRAGAPRRVVTLGGDITEIVFALGEGRLIVGRDATSTYPESVKSLPDTGYFRQLGAEGVLSLKPDLILAATGAGPKEALQQIASAGVQIIQLDDDPSPEGLLAKVQRIAEALKLADQGAALTRTLRAEIEATRASVAALNGRPRVLFTINAGGGAPMAAGRETAADALISLAGAVNVFATHTGYKAISTEAAAAAAPDAIAMMEHTLAAMGGVDGVVSHPALKMTPAATRKRIVARDGSYLLSFGPRLPAAILDFARAIRGEDST